MIVYAKRYLSLLFYLSFWTLINVNGFLHNEVVCGFPGTPANGQINITKESYKIGEQVSFFCDEGYERQGPPVNTCNNEGLWRNDLPLCLQNLAFKRLASQSSTENDFVASLAVDGNKLTCAETKFNNKTYNNTWSVQLDQEYTIDRIELKAQLANSYAQFNLSIQVMKSQDEKYFQICTRIQPRKGITSFEDSIQCGSGYRDIIGSVIRIVDLRLTRGKLKLCEVKVFAKQRYKCGKADLQPNCEVKYFEKNGLQHAEYHPKTNYQLVNGSNLRVCTNGKWSSNSPLCIDVVCGFPGTPANGKISIRKESYKIGEEVSFYCNEGYERFGPAENVCNNEGLWKDDLPLCFQDVAHKRLAEQTSTESDFVASLAVDGNKLTCAQTKFNNNTYNNMWWVQLDQEYLIETVQLKAQLASTYSQFNLSIQVLKSRDSNHFQSCANILLRKGITTYEGTIQCIREYQNISGSVIRIVDLRLTRGRLKLCDVKVFAKQKFRCGEPDVKPNCEVKYFERNDIQQAEYNPKKNYQLIKGSKLRACENGKWTLNAPLCVVAPRRTHQNGLKFGRKEENTNSNK